MTGTWRAIFFAAAVLLSLPGGVRSGHALGSSARPVPASVIITRDLSSGQRAFLRGYLSRLRQRIGRDLGWSPGTLQVEVFRTHRAFAQRLWTLQHVRPQGPTDNLGTVVHGHLLLGPLDARYLPHNLAHVYAEWVLDHQMDNSADSLPFHPWLYDGLAELEGYRLSPTAFPCIVHDSAPFKIGELSAAQWLAFRPGPWGPVEYCLAYDSVRSIVNRVGLTCLVRSLHGWMRYEAVARALLSSPARLPC